MTPFQMIDISERMAAGANICAEELVRLALQFGVELDVLVVYRPRHMDDKPPSMVALVAEKATVGKLLEGAFEAFLTGTETANDAYKISADE